MYAYTYNTETEAVTVFNGGIPNIIPVTDCRHTGVMEILDKYSSFGYSDDKAENNRLATEAMEAILKETPMSIKVKAAQTCIASADFDNLRLEEFGDGNIKVEYKGMEMPPVLSRKFMDMYKDGCTNFDPYFKFLDNIMANPRESVRNELYDFLGSSQVQLPIDEDGYFLAYKGVSSDMYSCTGSQRKSDGSFTTTVIQGKVDDQGRILNEVGTEIEVRVTDVCDDRSVACAQGLHVGSYDYANSFGDVTLAVLVNPRDVVSVPTECGCQKCRVSKYKVLQVIERPFKTATVDYDADNNARDTEFERRCIDEGKSVFDRNDTALIKMCIDRLMADGLDRTVKTIRQHLNSCGFDVNNYEVLSLIGENGSYTTSNVHGRVTKVLVNRVY